MVPHWATKPGDQKEIRRSLPDWGLLIVAAAFTLLADLLSAVGFAFLLMAVVSGLFWIVLGGCTGDFYNRFGNS